MKLWLKRLLLDGVGPLAILMATAISVMVPNPNDQLRMFTAGMVFLCW